MNGLFLKFLRKLDPETAHRISIIGLKYFSGFLETPYENDKLNSCLNDLIFKNPIGIAAGYDKNAEVINQLFKMGFGFVECGTVTPNSQTGNPRPRIFRLREDSAIINRLGFNNCGINQFVANFRKRNIYNGIAGANIGPNKTTKNYIDDYIKGFNLVYDFVDYITINVSSPNTRNLRNLQKNESLQELTGEISSLRKSKNIRKNILLKIDPDSSDLEYSNILNIIQKNGIDGLILTNTSISRPHNLKSFYKNEEGGLSGAPLKEISNRALKFIAKEVQGEIIVIGVGGITGAKDVYEKIRLGASLVQLYSALTFNNFGFINQIKKDLVVLLENDGFLNINEAVGIDL